MATRSLAGTWEPAGATGRLENSLGRYVVVALGLVAIWSGFGVVSDTTSFVALNVLLLGYLTVECISERRRNPTRWLVSPAVAASILTFIVSGVIPNVAYFSTTSPSHLLVSEYLGGEARFYWLNRAMGYTVVGAAAMWIGFRSVVGSSIGAALRQRAHKAALFRQTYEPRLLAVVGLIAIAFTARLFQSSLGVFGYGSDPEQLYAVAAYTQILALAASFMKFALLAVALSLFSRARSDAPIVALLVFAFVMEVLFSGFLAGFKGGVVFPVVAVATAYYWCRSRIKFSFVLVGVVFLMLAYAVVEPFRALRWADPSFDARSLTSIGSTARTAASYGAALNADTDMRSTVTTVSSRVLNRSNLTTFVAMAIKYKTEHHTLPDDAPRFLRNLIISPVSAFIPRLLWRDKPLQNIGFWFNVRVLEAPTFNAVAMGPVGYLFLAGGGLAVFLGFLAAGMFQRLLYELLRNDAGGVLAYLGIFSGLAIVESAFDAFFAGTLQSLLLFLIAQRVVFRR